MQLPDTPRLQFRGANIYWDTETPPASERCTPEQQAEMLENLKFLSDSCKSGGDGLAEG